MRGNHREYWLGLFITALLLSPTLVSLVHRVRNNAGDFSEFREDGRIALETRRLGAHLPLSYPPTTRPLFMFMSLSTPTVSGVAWWAVCVWMYWQTATWAGQRWLRPAFRRACTATFLALATGGVGIVADLTVGQLTALVLFCVMAAFELSQRRRPFVAGMALAIPLLVKPLPILLLPYFVIRRQWAVILAAGLVWLAAGPLLLAAIFGVQNEIDGWRHFRADTAGPRSPSRFFQDWEQRPAGDETYRRSGLSSTLVRLFRPVTYDGRGGSVQIATLSAKSILLIWLCIVGGVAGWSACVAYRGGSQSADRAFAGFLCAMLLANPHFISYWLAVCLVPATLLLGRCVAARAPDIARRDRGIALAALIVWAASLVAFAFPVCRAAGSVVISVVALALGVLLIRDGAPRRFEARPVA